MKSQNGVPIVSGQSFIVLLVQLTSLYHPTQELIVRTPFMHSLTRNPVNVWESQID